MPRYQEMAPRHRPTATAYGGPGTGNAPGTECEVSVRTSVDVDADALVRVVTMPGGSGDWHTAGRTLWLRRAQLGYIRRPGRNPDAIVAAYTAMAVLGDLAGRAGTSLRDRDPVGYWDLMTAMADQRAALWLAHGVPVELVDRSGYDVSTPAVRAALAASRAEHGAR